MKAQIMTDAEVKKIEDRLDGTFSTFEMRELMRKKGRRHNCAKAEEAFRSYLQDLYGQLNR